MNAHPSPAPSPELRLLIAGATGLVGQSLLRLALADPRVRQVVAPTRRPLPPHPRLLNPVVDFDRLPDDAGWWKADAAICALGTTLRDAGSRPAFARVDRDYPLRIARLAQAGGTDAFVLVSATGADPHSRVFYSRTKGELERELRTMRFASLTLVRPSLLGGERAQRRPLERAGLMLAGAVTALLPPRYRVVPADAVARALLAAALTRAPGVHIIESEAIAAA